MSALRRLLSKSTNTAFVCMRYALTSQEEERN